MDASRGAVAPAQPDEQERRAARRGLLLWALLGALGCAIVAPFEPSLLEEGFHLYAAERMLRGELLYRDHLAFTGPLPFEWLAALFRAFGPSVWWARGSIVVLHGLATAGVFGIARRSRGGPAAHVAAALYAAAPVLLFPFLSIYFYGTIAIGLAVLAAAATLRAIASGRGAALAGALVAAVALCKQNLGVSVAVALALALLTLSPRERRWRAGAAYALGGASVALLVAAAWALRGGLDDLLRGMVTLPLSFTTSFSSPFINLWPPGRLAPEIHPTAGIYLPFVWSAVLQGIYEQPGRGLVLLTQALYALPFAALLATVLRRLRGPLPAGIWVHAALLAALIPNLFPRSDWGHLAFVLPSAAVQAWLVLAPCAPGRPRLARGVAAAALLALGLGVAGFGRVLYGHAVEPNLGPRVPLRPVSIALRQSGVARVVAFLRNRLQPLEPIFVARSEPLVYFATGARNPTPYPGVIPAMREEQERTILGALPSVRFVVMSDIDQGTFTYYRRELPRVQAYLERYFRVPRAFALGPHNWILVLQRDRDRGESLVDLFDRRHEGEAWVRDWRGGEQPAEASPVVLATRHNRRPLAVRLGTGGGGIDFEVDVPAGALLQADVGLRRATSLDHIYEHPDAVRMIVSIGRGDALEPQLEVPILYERFHGRTWMPAELDLSPWAGQRVRLRLETRPDGPLPDGGLAWWGSPRIARRPPAR